MYLLQPYFGEMKLTNKLLWKLISVDELNLSIKKIYSGAFFFNG